MTAPVPLDTVFRFFEDPRSLEKITPPWLNFRILNPDAVRMRAGEEIHYIISWMGIPLKWKTRIAEYTPPRKFVDEQEKGPYTLWHHEHFFEQTEAGVVIRDCVDYILPLGPLGRLAHFFMVKAQLLEIFRYRQKTIAAILNTPGITYDSPVVRVIER